MLRRSNASYFSASQHFFVGTIVFKISDERNNLEHCPSPRHQASQAYAL
jgi:hypothetical protein